MYRSIAAKRAPFLAILALAAIAVLWLTSAVLADPGPGDATLICPADLQAQHEQQVAAKQEMPLTCAERDELAQHAQMMARLAARGETAAAQGCTVSATQPVANPTPHPVYSDALVDFIPGCPTGLLEPVTAKPYIIGQAVPEPALAEAALADVIPGCSDGLVPKAGWEACELPNRAAAGRAAAGDHPCGGCVADDCELDGAAFGLPIRRGHTRGPLA